MDIVFTPTGWTEYSKWLAEDKKTVQKINKLIKSIDRDGPLSGEGKPEKLRHIDGYSRNIDEKNRLVYQYAKEKVTILSCEGHYQD